jgi:hypothetical protein
LPVTKGDLCLLPKLVFHVVSTMTTTVQDGPSPTPPTIQQDQMEAATKGEVVSR